MFFLFFYGYCPHPDPPTQIWINPYFFSFFYWTLPQVTKRFGGSKSRCERTSDSINWKYKECWWKGRLTSYKMTGKFIEQFTNQELLNTKNLTIERVRFFWRFLLWRHLCSLEKDPLSTPIYRDLIGGLKLMCFNIIEFTDSPFLKFQSIIRRIPMKNLPFIK